MLNDIILFILSFSIFLMYLGCFAYTFCIFINAILCLCKWLLSFLRHDDALPKAFLDEINEIRRRINEDSKELEKFFTDIKDKYGSLLDDKLVDKNEKIKEYLDIYLERKKTNFAVFIKGAWGSGKTYFINHYKSKNKEKCYVSLFGISNKNELEFRLWKGMLFDPPYIITKRITKKIFIGLIIILLGWCFMSDALHFLLMKYPIQKEYCLTFFKELSSSWIFQLNWGSLSIIATIILFIWKFIRLKAMEVFLQKRFLVLDDWERVETSCDEVLSWINEFVEHINCPVIIIGNEDAIINNFEFKYKEQSEEKIKHYEKVKEKIIGIEFNFEQNDGIVCQNLIENLNDSSFLKKVLYNKQNYNNLMWFIEEVLDPLKKEPYKHQTNYRVLTYCFEEFDNCINNCINNCVVNKGAWQKILDDEKDWKEMIARFITILYLKKIHVIPIAKEAGSIFKRKIDDLVDIEYSETLAERLLSDYFPFRQNLIQQDKIAVAYSKLYPKLFEYPSLISDIIHCIMFESKDKEYKKFLCPLKHFIISDNEPMELRWIDVSNLDDNNYEILLNNTENEFSSPSINSIHELVYFVQGLCINFEKGYIKRWDESQLKNKIENYIDKVIDNDNYDIDSLVQNQQNYKKIKNHINEFTIEQQDKETLLSVIQVKLLDKLDELYNKSLSKLFVSIIENIKNNSNSFGDWYKAENMIYKDSFSFQSSEELWNAMKDLSTKEFKTILKCFKEHINDYLKMTEIEFWEEFIKLAKIDLGEWQTKNINIWKGDCLETFCKEVNDKLVEYKDKSKLKLKIYHDNNLEGTN